MNMTASPESREEAGHAVDQVLDASRAGNHALASTLAKAALERGVWHPTLLEVRARWSAARGCDAEALADLEALRAWSPEDPVLLVRIAHLLTKLG
ncbi:MAG: hypothetical protein ACREHV_07465, partial [Rhizomicrobium sp.]